MPIRRCNSPTAWPTRIESRPIPVQGNDMLVTVSIGIALSTDNLDNPEALLRDADMAMYRAKANGRAHRELFHERHREEDESGAVLIEELGRALETGELRLHYQPIVSLDGPLRGSRLCSAGATRVAASSIPRTSCRRPRKAA